MKITGMVKTEAAIVVSTSFEARRASAPYAAHNTTGNVTPGIAPSRARPSISQCGRFIAWAGGIINNGITTRLTSPTQAPRPTTLLKS